MLNVALEMGKSCVCVCVCMTLCPVTVSTEQYRDYSSSTHTVTHTHTHRTHTPSTALSNPRRNERGGMHEANDSREATVMVRTGGSLL